MKIAVLATAAALVFALTGSQANIPEGGMKSRVAQPQPDSGRSFMAQLAEEAPHPLLGKPAPKFTLNTLDGGKFNLADEIGKKIIVLDFWATWCGPCRAALPILISVTDEYKNKNKNLPVVFYGINQRETPDKIRAFFEKAGLKFNVALDSDATVGDMYQVEGIPQSVIIGKDGTVQAVHVGLSRELEARLKQELDTLTSGKNLVTPPNTNKPASPNAVH